MITLLTAFALVHYEADWYWWIPFFLVALKEIVEA